MMSNYGTATVADINGSYVANADVEGLGLGRGRRADVLWVQLSCPPGSAALSL
jgi:hypothetical protein